MLDIRPLAEFRAGHLPGAVSHPVTPPPSAAETAAHFEAELPSIFLPPRHVPLTLCGAEAELVRALADHLEARGRAAVRVLASAELDRCGPLATGSRCGHLWEPPPWLSAHEGWLPPPAAGPVLDLACGSGRACVWLGERGYRVTGVDWQPEALALGRQLARSRGAEVAWVQADLRDADAVPGGPWSVILNFRYLQPDLLRRCAQWLQPGGVAFVRTFRSAVGYTGHPHPRHRLDCGELPGYFAAGEFEVLAHEESHDPDGRPAAGIVARRRRG